MIPLTLSTMFAQQERFADIADFVRTARALGFDAIEVSHLTSVEPMRRLAEIDAPVVSVHAPAPLSQDPEGRDNSSLNLASLDEAERRAAVEQSQRSIDWAARLGARFVVLHLGGVGPEPMDAERALRRLFDSGVREGPEVEALRRECLERRADHRGADDYG